MQELRPTKGPFLFGRLTVGLGGATVLFVGCAGGAVAAEVYALIGVGALVAGALVCFSMISGAVAWKKERYEIHHKGLLARGGGLLSDRTTELDFRNVTHVKQRLSFLRYRLFNVGDVIVQSAGSSSAEVVFRSVREPDVLYEHIRQKLRDNGFSLQAKECLHSESPSTLGALLEVVQLLLGASFVVGGGSSAVLAGLATLGPAGMVLAGLGAVLLPVVVLTWLGLHVVDLKRRTYEVHDDVIEYREGFLSRTNAFIPCENIADAATHQTFIDQALGLWDVRVSCQGSGADVAFRRLANGPALQAAVRDRVAHAQRLRQAEERAAVEGPASAEGGAPQPISRPGAAPVPAEEAWTADLKMSMLRAVLSGGLLPAIATRYRVGPSSLSSVYSLFGRRELEFAYDKVTGLQVSTGPWDALLGTFSVKIWSIGSATPITLAHVKRDDVDLEALLRQCGIPGGAAQLELPAAFSVGTFARAHAVGFFFWLPWVLASLCTLAVPLAGSVAWAGLRARKQHLRLHEHHVELEQGVLFRRHTYARYDDIKKVTVQRYAGTDAGSLTLFVAGETQIQTSKGGTTVVPNRFTANYLPDVTPFITSLDALLQGRISAPQVTTALTVGQAAEYQPAVANGLTTLFLIGLFFPPLWLLAPWSVLALKRRRYRVEAERAVLEEGVVYRSHTSVLFDRIDSLKQGQGVLGKAFGNGNVTLFTAGSSQPDLLLRDCPEYETLYTAIRARYGR